MRAKSVLPSQTTKISDNSEVVEWSAVAPPNPPSTVKDLYKRFKDGDTRILELVPRDGSDCIKVRFLVIPIEDENVFPDYEALSYTWSGVDTKIVCNDLNFNTTSNLRDALAQLRLPDRSRLVWADQICINQTDFYEKEAQQIPLLPENLRKGPACLDLATQDTVTKDVSVV